MAMAGRVTAVRVTAGRAKAVSRRMGIAQRQPIDPASQGLAGDATVVIIAGADLSQ